MGVGKSAVPKDKKFCSQQAKRWGRVSGAIWESQIKQVSRSSRDFSGVPEKRRSGGVLSGL
jgi:hypothetical protein